MAKEQTLNQEGSESTGELLSGGVWSQCEGNVSETWGSGPGGQPLEAQAPEKIPGKRT